MRSTRKGSVRCAAVFAACKNDRVRAPNTSGACRAGISPAAAQEPQTMFTDLTTARKNALGLSKTLMMATMVILVGTHYAVITAEDLDASVTVINEYDPFA
jgi:hypothetical protein